MYIFLAGQELPPSTEHNHFSELVLSPDENSKWTLRVPATVPVVFSRYHRYTMTSVTALQSTCLFLLSHPCSRPVGELGDGAKDQKESYNQSLLLATFFMQPRIVYCFAWGRLRWRLCVTFYWER